MPTPNTTELALRMAELARSLSMPRPVETVLADTTAAAVELVAGADTAGILLVGKAGKFESLAGTDGVPHKLDALQINLGEGPCVAAALGENIVRTDDFRTETRWPRYSRAVIEAGVLSGLSFKLYTADRTAGALNLFGFSPTVWTSEAETTGVVLAAHAAAAILASRHGEHLESALSTRDRIGQAKGILMERFGIDDVAAFDMMRQISQESNTRLIDIAQRVIDTRRRETAESVVSGHSAAIAGDRPRR